MVASRVAALVVVAAFAIASGAAAALSPGQYRLHASTICTTTRSKLDARQGPPRHISKTALIDVVEKGVTVLQVQLRALLRLDPPPSIRPLHRRILSLEAQRIVRYEKLIRQIRPTNDRATILRVFLAAIAPTTTSDPEAVAWKRLHVPACVGVS